MKISKSFLSKIIKEEIKRALYNESSEEDPQWVKPIIHLFIQIKNEMGNTNPDTDTKENYIKSISQIAKKYDSSMQEFDSKTVASKVFEYLNGKIDNDLYRDLAQLLNGEVSTNLFADFDDNITPASYKTTDPKRTPMDDIRPSKIEPQRQEDPRHKKKNLVH